MANENVPIQLELEEIFKWPSVEALNINIDCKNTDCPFSAPTEDLANHERKCRFRTVGCPFPDACSDTIIPMNGIVEHLGTREHLGTLQGSAFESMSSAGTCSIEWDPSRFNEGTFISYGCTVRKHLGDHFILYVAIVNDEIHAWVTVIGDAEVARKYSATITMGKDEQKTTICRGRVHSIDEVKDNGEDFDHGVLCRTESGKWITLDYEISETAEVEDDFILL